MNDAMLNEDSKIEFSFEMDGHTESKMCIFRDFSVCHVLQFVKNCEKKYSRINTGGRSQKYVVAYNILDLYTRPWDYDHEWTCHQQETRLMSAQHVISLVFVRNISPKLSTGENTIDDVRKYSVFQVERNTNLRGCGSRKPYQIPSGPCKDYNNRARRLGIKCVRYHRPLKTYSQTTERKNKKGEYETVYGGQLSHVLKIKTGIYIFASPAKIRLKTVTLLLLEVLSVIPDNENTNICRYAQIQESVPFNKSRNTIIKKVNETKSSRKYYTKNVDKVVRNRLNFLVKLSANQGRTKNGGKVVRNRLNFLVKLSANQGHSKNVDKVGRNHLNVLAKLSANQGRTKNVDKVVRNHLNLLANLSANQGHTKNVDKVVRNHLNVLANLSANQGPEGVPCASATKSVHSSLQSCSTASGCKPHARESIARESYLELNESWPGRLLMFKQRKCMGLEWKRISHKLEITEADIQTFLSDRSNTEAIHLQLSDASKSLQFPNVLNCFQILKVLKSLKISGVSKSQQIQNCSKFLQISDVSQFLPFLCVTGLLQFVVFEAVILLIKKCVTRQFTNNEDQIICDGIKLLTYRDLAQMIRPANMAELNRNNCKGEDVSPEGRVGGGRSRNRRSFRTISSRCTTTVGNVHCEILNPPTVLSATDRVYHLHSGVRTRQQTPGRDDAHSTRLTFSTNVENVAGRSPCQPEPFHGYSQSDPSQSHCQPEPFQGYSQSHPSQTRCQPEPFQGYSQSHPSKTRCQPEPFQGYSQSHPSQSHCLAHPSQCLCPPDPRQGQHLPNSTQYCRLPDSSQSYISINPSQCHILPDPSQYQSLPDPSEPHGLHETDRQDNTNVSSELQTSSSPEDLLSNVIRNAGLSEDDVDAFLSSDARIESFLLKNCIFQEQSSHSSEAHDFLYSLFGALGNVIPVKVGGQSENDTNSCSVSEMNRMPQPEMQRPTWSNAAECSRNAAATRGQDMELGTNNMTSSTSTGCCANYSPFEWVVCRHNYVSHPENEPSTSAGLPTNHISVPLTGSHVEARYSNRRDVMEMLTPVASKQDFDNSDNLCRLKNMCYQELSESGLTDSELAEDTRLSADHNQSTFHPVVQDTCVDHEHLPTNGNDWNQSEHPMMDTDEESSMGKLSSLTPEIRSQQNHRAEHPNTRIDFSERDTVANARPSKSRRLPKLILEKYVGPFARSKTKRKSATACGEFEHSLVKMRTSRTSPNCVDDSSNGQAIKGKIGKRRKHHEISYNLRSCSAWRRWSHRIERTKALKLSVLTPMT